MGRLFIFALSRAASPEHVGAAVYAATHLEGTRAVDIALYDRRFLRRVALSWLYASLPGVYFPACSPLRSNYYCRGAFWDRAYLSEAGRRGRHGADGSGLWLPLLLYRQPVLAHDRTRTLRYAPALYRRIRYCRRA